MAMTPSPWQVSQRPPLTLNEKRPGRKPRARDFGQHREQLADEREQAGVGRRVRARRPADGRLVDLDHLVDQVDAFDRRVRARLVGRAIQRPRERPVEDLVHERRLARAADAGHGDQDAERKLDVDVLQVVLARALDDDRAAARRPPCVAGVSIDFSPPEVRAGQRAVAVGQQVRRLALEDHVPAVLSRARPEIDHVVGRADRLLVVLDDHDGVAEIAQPRQRRQQRAVVALVQADRRLVEHVEHAGQVRADLGRQPDALPFAARQRRGAAAEREVADADVVQEAQPIADLPQDAAGDQVLAVGQLEALEHVQRFGDRQVHVLGDRPALDPDRAALRLQPRPLAGRARTERAIRLEALLLDPAALFVAPPQVRDEPFEAGAERILRLRLSGPEPGARRTAHRGSSSAAA